ncbi:MAG TPA: hypothetical protein VK208_14165 [Pyrinomonadaceae bacterium]|nr:hypothetical protein [Pyrinomonadaceae bacterium]
MHTVASFDWPAVAQIYQIAERLLLVDAPSKALAIATDRVLSTLRISHTDSDLAKLPAATLRLASRKFELPDDIEICAVTEEATYYQNENQYLVRLGDSVVSAGDSTAVNIWLSDGLDPESLLFGRIFSHGLATALRRAGAYELHCAVVVSPETHAAALIIGPSGSGKTTLALQLAASGWNFSTDDVALLTTNGDSVEVHGLRRFFAVAPETILHIGLPQLGFPESAANNDLKIRLHPQNLFSSTQVDKCLATTLIFASRTGTPNSKVVQLSQADMMRRLLKMCPWASIDRPVANSFLQVLSLLTRQCRGFDLLAGTDLIGDAHYTAAFVSSIVSTQAA